MAQIKGDSPSCLFFRLVSICLVDSPYVFEGVEWPVKRERDNERLPMPITDVLFSGDFAPAVPKLEPLYTAFWEGVSRRFYGLFSRISRDGCELCFYRCGVGLGFPRCRLSSQANKKKIGQRGKARKA